jgi:PII-like signaling protein
MTKMLMIFVDETDMWQDERLYEVLVRALFKRNVAGATVVHGFMGYGMHRHIHKKELLGISDERPVLILAIDEEERLRQAIPDLIPLVKEGLINLVDTEVISRGTSVNLPPVA